MDTLITGMILWGIIASIYGVKKFKEKTDHDEHTNHLILKDTENHDQHNSRAKKRGILSRIFFGNK